MRRGNIQTWLIRLAIASSIATIVACKGYLPELDEQIEISVTPQEIAEIVVLHEDIKTSVVEYSYPLTNRQFLIVLLGMAHNASPKFYDSRRECIRNYTEKFDFGVILNEDRKCPDGMYRYSVLKENRAEFDELIANWSLSSTRSELMRDLALRLNERARKKSAESRLPISAGLCRTVTSAPSSPSDPACFSGPLQKQSCRIKDMFKNVEIVDAEVSWDSLEPWQQLALEYVIIKIEEHSPCSEEHPAAWAMCSLGAKVLYSEREKYILQKIWKAFEQGHDLVIIPWGQAHIERIATQLDKLGFKRNETPSVQCQP